MNKGEKTKQLIIEKSRKLFAKKGFDSTKTSEIAKASGISEATIYKYFDSKIDLLLACITPVEEENVEEKDFSQLPLKQLVEEYITIVVEKMINNRSQYEILFNEAIHHPEISTEYVKRIHQQNPIEKEIEKRIRMEEISTISNYFMFHVGLIGALIAMMNHHEIHQLSEENYLTNTKVQEMVDFLYYGMKGNKEDRS
ncbi:hypothetical protein J6TS2_24450 [Heyndrickxia sporothermodurans]|nr:hypothetical protein J6TS2_24450 [Heyndrickxia sporothermodurans]